jgi:nicotinamidase-related amidase
VITGQSTFACVDTTARDALCHDYYVVVVEDAVASVAEQWEYHLASLKVLRQFLPVRGVATAAEIEAVWENAMASASRSGLLEESQVALP